MSERNYINPWQLNIRSEHFIPADKIPNKKIIVAGFPGVGKTTAVKNHPELFIDMESSDYHWVWENGERKANKDWPNNYINEIINLSKDEPKPGEPIYILISTHKEVLDILAKKGMYYLAVVPKSKDIYIQRYIDRGNNEKFVDLLKNKFEDFVKDVEKSSAFGIYYGDGYLEDIFTSGSRVEIASDSKYDDTMISSFNPNAFPSNYTDKIIIAVWPYEFMKDFISCDVITHLSVEDMMHEYKEKYKGFNEDISCIRGSVAEDYVKFACQIANDRRLETPYIVIDGSIGVIKTLCDKDINFIMALPISRGKALEMNFGSKDKFNDVFLKTDKSLSTFCTYIQQLCFHTIKSDDDFNNVLKLKSGQIDRSYGKFSEYDITENDTIIGYEFNGNNSVLEYSSGFSEEEKERFKEFKDCIDKI